VSEPDGAPPAEAISTVAGPGRPAPIRLAGIVAQDEATEVIWSIAEGWRGRRWREASVRLGRLAGTRVIEISPEGRLQRIEAAAPVGMLTLHPSEDGSTLHGNVVTAEGVRHLALPWGPAHRLVVAGSIGAVAVACQGLDTLIQPGGSTVFRGISIDADLSIGEGSVRIERSGLSGWRISAPEFSVESAAELDSDGLPQGGVGWPLELPTEA
jgi:hypothetical protein